VLLLECSEEKLPEKLAAKPPHGGGGCCARAPVMFIATFTKPGFKAHGIEVVLVQTMLAPSVSC